MMIRLTRLIIPSVAAVAAAASAVALTGCNTIEGLGQGVAATAQGLGEGVSSVGQGLGSDFQDASNEVEREIDD